MKTCSATPRELRGGGRDLNNYARASRMLNKESFGWGGKWDTWRPSNTLTHFQSILNLKLHLSRCSVIPQSDNHLRPELISGTFWRRTVHAQWNCTNCDSSSSLVGGLWAHKRQKTASSGTCAQHQRNSPDYCDTAGSKGCNTRHINVAHSQ